MVFLPFKGVIHYVVWLTKIKLILWYFFRYNKTETPDVEVVEEVKEKDKHIGLDKFLSKYTSEDNDSYEFIIERYNRLSVAFLTV